MSPLEATLLVGLYEDFRLWVFRRRVVPWCAHTSTPILASTPYHNNDLQLVGGLLTEVFLKTSSVLYAPVWIVYET
jgi:hypothetical protein